MSDFHAWLETTFVTAITPDAVAAWRRELEERAMSDEAKWCGCVESNETWERYSVGQSVGVWRHGQGSFTARVVAPSAVARLDCPSCGGTGRARAEDTRESLAGEWDRYALESGNWLSGVLRDGYAQRETGARWNTPQERATWVAVQSAQHCEVPADLVQRTEAFIERERAKRATHFAKAAEFASVAVKVDAGMTDPATSDGVLRVPERPSATATITGSTGSFYGWTDEYGMPRIASAGEAQTLTQPFNAKTAEGIIRAIQRERDDARNHLAIIGRTANAPRIPTAADFDALDAHLVAMAKGNELNIAGVENARAQVRELRSTLDTLGACAPVFDAMRLLVDVAWQAKREMDAESDGLRFDLMVDE